LIELCQYSNVKNAGVQRTPPSVGIGVESPLQMMWTCPMSENDITARPFAPNVPLPITRMEVQQDSNTNGTGNSRKNRMWNLIESNYFRP